ncbi:hypothetical protein FRB97_008835 [Tulasnella sp. 331]|nr:hypothetical protein FRB97_008835 [Tulasnella sp. 331]
MPVLGAPVASTFTNGATTKVTSPGEVDRRSHLLKRITIRDASGVFEDIIEGMSATRGLTFIDILGAIGLVHFNEDNITLIVDYRPYLEVLILKPRIQDAALTRVDLPLNLPDLPSDTSAVDFHALVETPSMTATKVAVMFIIGPTNITRAARFLAELLLSVVDLGLSAVRLIPEQREERCQLVRESHRYRASQHFLAAAAHPQD